MLWRREAFIDQAHAPLLNSLGNENIFCEDITLVMHNFLPYWPSWQKFHLLLSFLFKYLQAAWLSISWSWQSTIVFHELFMTTSIFGENSWFGVLSQASYIRTMIFCWFRWPSCVTDPEIQKTCHTPCHIIHIIYILSNKLDSQFLISNMYTIGFMINKGVYLFLTC